MDFGVRRNAPHAARRCALDRPHERNHPKQRVRPHSNLDRESLDDVGDTCFR